ncbi:MAG: isochorismate synthase [Actinomycetota bacterium]
MSANGADGPSTERFWRAGPRFRYLSIRSGRRAEGGFVLRTPIDDQAAVARVMATVEQSAADGGPGLVCGVVPFRPSDPATLLVPDVVDHLTASGPGPTQSMLPSVVESTPIPEGERYADTVATAVRAIGGGAMDKVVLGRCLDLDLNGVIDPVAMWHRLTEAEPSASHFLATLTGGEVLVGASPELLIAKAGSSISSHPLAGSAARSADPTVDADRAAGLLQSTKDLREHELVVTEIADTLTPHCAQLIVPRRPNLVGTSRLWHLGTLIDGQLKDGGQSVLDLVREIHPTPALCGLPRSDAMDFIEQEEPFDRQVFGGAVGWVDSAGDGEWSVVIRSARLRPRSIRLFAGAGIVEGSIPELELAETHTKLSTVLAVLGGTGLDATGNPLRKVAS